MFKQLYSIKCVGFLYYDNGNTTLAQVEISNVEQVTHLPELLKYSKIS